jgi:hypothetical protein
MSSFAAALAHHPQAVHRLLQAHVPDRDGRCRGCAGGGSGLPGPRWPCTLRFHAAAAEQLMDGPRAPGDPAPP